MDSLCYNFFLVSVPRSARTALDHWKVGESDDSTGCIGLHELTRSGVKNPQPNLIGKRDGAASSRALRFWR
jgi:hypothetical protein